MQDVKKKILLTLDCLSLLIFFLLDIIHLNVLEIMLIGIAKANRSNCQVRERVEEGHKGHGDHNG